MYITNQAILPPSDKNQPIWRYQDFAKLLNLIQTSKLFFCRVDKFEDPFEGSVTKQTVKLREQFHKEISTQYKFPQNQFTELLKDVRISLRESTYVNCWHMNISESAAMWKLYSKDMHSVAIRSNFERLVNSFKVTEMEVTIGQVKYVDYESVLIPEGNALFPVLYKRLSFEHEKELRAMIILPGDKSKEVKLPNVMTSDGILVNVNLNELIEEIFISPLAPKWFAETAKLAINKYGLTCPVRYSKLNEQPVF